MTGTNLTRLERLEADSLCILRERVEALGGNVRVVCSVDLGSVVPFGDGAAVRQALVSALQTDWNRGPRQHGRRADSEHTRHAD